MKTAYLFAIPFPLIPLALGGVLAGACASTGTEPHAMTAGEHQAAASAETQAAAEHQAQYSPAASRPTGPPAPSSGAYTSACSAYSSTNCAVHWKSTENPTEQHLKLAERHRKLAAQHRAASKALVEAERQFCAGISDDDRDISPFAHRDDITRVEIVKKKVRTYGGETATGSPIGARVVFRAVPAMTAEWLQRSVDCHLARSAVVGEDPAMSFCPLAVRHSSAIVTSTGTGFAVEVTSDDPDSVHEIIHRAEALAPGGTTALR